MDYKLHDGTLFDYSANVYCGVLITQKVLKKLAALQAEYLENVKSILSDGADAGDVFPSSWTLHYPEGKQTEVRYIDLSEDVRKRIELAVNKDAPRVQKLVFIAKSMDEAKRMAEARYNAINPSEVQP